MKREPSTRSCERQQGISFPDDLIIHHKIFGHIVPHLFWGYGLMSSEQYAIDSENRYRQRALRRPPRMWSPPR